MPHFPTCSNSDLFFFRLVFKARSKPALTLFQAQQQCLPSCFSRGRVSTSFNDSCMDGVNAFSPVKPNVTANCLCCLRMRRASLEICLGRRLKADSFLSPKQKPLTLMEFSVELPLILTGSQAPSSSRRFQELCSPAGRFGEFVQLHQAKQRARAPGLYRQLGDEVQENLDFLPQPVLKRPGRKSCVRVHLLFFFSPPPLLPVCASALHSAAATLKCLAGTFSWQVSIWESHWGLFSFIFFSPFWLYIEAWGKQPELSLLRVLLLAGK